MKKSHFAFTFIEILIVFFIIGILAAITLPSLKFFLNDNQDKILQQQIINLISIAKSESQMRHMPVSICKSNNQKTCDGNWEDGQIIFLDKNKNGKINSNDKILNVTMSSSSHGSLHWRSFPSKKYLLFLPMEWSSNNGSFWHCHEKEIKWAIVINKAGRTHTLYPDKDGLIRDSHGKVFLCSSLLE